MSEMARVVRFDELGGPEVLKIDELPVTAPGLGEVAIRVEAVALNRAEALFRSGGYYYQPALPGSRLGYEAAGVVTATGPGVTAFAAGDPVLAGPGIEMSAQGVHADRIVLPATSVLRRPGGLDAVRGAAAWVAYSTAYGGLLETGGLRPGDHVLITAASSGVGLAALQVAARTGAIPIAVTRSAAKAGVLRANGAAEVIVDGAEDVPETARELTGGTGVALIFDPVGGPGLAALGAAAAENGTVVVYGWLGGAGMTLPLNWPLTVRGYANPQLSATPDGRRRMWHHLDAGVRDGSLRPVVAEVFDGLDRIGDAHRLMETNTHAGKIVVTV
ncbi:NADPH:quinone reductase-like Zn-dependent oxidoreductase [Actinoplanes octamycinicus]|uniref:NADPH:quinone reductase-like Zn-dependent oxidoreductase n=1 Tax=Actinoplanes octamycinicus TaxID=135948 RepID=A0A7W7GZV7_9ACTN|nr:zinc-dependent alcohol dehydrogenase family protein [Actinoplanes octamycinicus]MBB4741282.1 NADPH:quinone reductase-like Zn-dependent oxidoreductase [Actinoplanes octamycinicus]GIE62917.1 NADPH:quinone reductase [Actinoplanes octamycinicus]